MHFQAEKEKNNRKGDSAFAPSQFASLFEGDMQQILTESLNFSVLKLLNVKLELSTENSK